MLTPDNRRAFSLCRLSLENLEERTVLSATVLAAPMQVQYQSAASAASIVSADRLGGSASNLSAIRVTFDRSMSSASFTAADIGFTGPDGKAIAIASVKPVAGSVDRVYDITFAAQTKAGNYTLKIGADIKGWDGKLNTPFQKAFAVAGAAAQTVTPPSQSAASAASIVSADRLGGSASNLSAIRVTFDRSMSSASFTAADIGFTGPDGKAIAIASVKPVAGSVDRVYDITFAAQTKAGNYTLKIGADIKGWDGKLNTPFQKAFAVAGAAAQTVTPPSQSAASAASIVSADRLGGSASNLSAIRVTFDRSMSSASFTAADIGFTGPDGKAIAIASVKPVAGSVDRVYDITFAAQTKAGNYTLKIGADIKGWDGKLNTPFQKAFAVAGAAAQTVTAPLTLTNVVSINGSTANLNTIRLTFARTVNASTFTASDIVLTGPDGKAIAVTVKAVAGYSGNVFDVTFAAQSRAGTYTFKVGPAISDTKGVAMSAMVTRTFSVAQATTSSNNALPTAYSSQGTANVPPRGTGGSVISVNKSAMIRSVVVSVDITTARASDLKVWLQAPDGTTVVLANQSGGNAANFVDAMFTDAGSGPIPTNKSVIYGTFTPSSPLSVLAGKNMAGTWKLWVQDQTGARTSVLTGWSMIITPQG